MTRALPFVPLGVLRLQDHMEATLADIRVDAAEFFSEQGRYLRDMFQDWKAQALNPDMIQEMRRIIDSVSSPAISPHNHENSTQDPVDES